MGSCNDKLQVLLSPPRVFGRVETGQVFVLFDNVHLFIGPKEEKETWKNNFKCIILL